MKLDILAFGAHPDDVELSAAGTLLHYIAQGKSVGIVDLTEGELGTRGSVESRYDEAAEAAKIIENTQRDVNIALINELSIIFNKLKINTFDVLEAAGTKWNFLKFLHLKFQIDLS